MLTRNSMGSTARTGRASRYDATFIFLYWKMKTLSADVATVSKEMGRLLGGRGSRKTRLNGSVTHPPWKQGGEHGPARINKGNPRVDSVIACPCSHLSPANLRRNSFL